jgi:hypothetical protein
VEIHSIPRANGETMAAARMYLSVGQEGRTADGRAAGMQCAAG